MHERRVGSATVASRAPIRLCCLPAVQLQLDPARLPDILLSLLCRPDSPRRLVNHRGMQSFMPLTFTVHPIWAELRQWPPPVSHCLLAAPTPDGDTSCTVQA